MSATQWIAGTPGDTFDISLLFRAMDVFFWLAGIVLSAAVTPVLVLLMIYEKVKEWMDEQ